MAHGKSTVLTPLRCILYLPPRSHGAVDMPSISLGFEQVEMRLGLIRRRLNLFALQHTLYLGGSLAALSATLLIFLAVRGQTEAFNLALWIVILSGAAACSWAVYALRRRWLSIENVARLADQKGKLDDRLSTLLAHRGNGPTRLWSLLLTQALTLSSRWDTRVVAPRRIPRSLFYLLGSLAILVATSFFVSAPSSEGKTMGSASPSTAAADRHHPPIGKQDLSSAGAFGHPASKGAGATAKDGDGNLMPTHLTAGGEQSAAGEQAGPLRVAQAGGSGGTNRGPGDKEEKASGPMPARMQNLIRRLFGVAPVANHSGRTGANMPSGLPQGKNSNGESTEKTAGDGERLARSGQTQLGAERNPRRQPGKRQIVWGSGRGTGRFQGGRARRLQKRRALRPAGRKGDGRGREVVHAQADDLLVQCSNRSGAAAKQTAQHGVRHGAGRRRRRDRIAHERADDARRSSSANGGLGGTRSDPATDLHSELK